MDHALDIKPASVAEVQRMFTGHTVVVTEDVQNVASDLAELGPFHLHYDPLQDIYVVMQRMPDGSEQLVTSAQECDQRIVHRVREVTAPGYDIAAEVEKVEKARAKADEHAFNEAVGEKAERLAHALRKDLEHDIRLA